LISNGTSEVRVYDSGNVAFTIGGVANVVLVTASGLTVVGNANSGNVNTTIVAATNGRLSSSLNVGGGEVGSPNTVVITNGVTAQQLLVEQDTHISGTLTVNRLVLKESANTDTHAWDELVALSADKVKNQLTSEWRESLVQQTIQLAKTSGIDFDQITLNGQPLVTGNSLNSHITHTSIRKTGALENLKVSGAVNFANQALTADNRRVGINTAEPDMALSVWDEETSISLGKMSQNVAYIGAGRKHDLVIGIDRKEQIRLDTTGLTTVSQLRVDRWRIQHHATVPGWSGTRGDFVFNNDVKDDLVFAWVCLGGFRWQPLKSA
jgi:hypothetical protein